MQPGKDDLQLIDRIKSGEKEAFRELYDKYRRILLNYLYRMLNDRDLAEEITQQALIKAYFNIDKYKPVGTFCSWIYTIAKNLARNELKKKRKMKKVSLEKTVSENGKVALGDILQSPLSSVEDKLEKEEVKKGIESALAALPDNHREVITLCWIQGRSYDEAAKIIGCTRDAVACRLRRAKESFMKAFKPKVEEKK